jgi:L-asparaginase
VHAASSSSSPALSTRRSTVRKVHPYRLDAFGSGDAGPIARVEEGRVRSFRNWPEGEAAKLGLDRLPSDASAWPWVAVVTSGAGTDARAVRALVDAGCAGIVVAATGNGRVHAALEARCARRWRAAAPSCAARAASTAP